MKKEVSPTAIVVAVIVIVVVAIGLFFTLLGRKREAMSDERMADLARQKASQGQKGMMTPEAKMQQLKRQMQQGGGASR